MMSDQASSKQVVAVRVRPLIKRELKSGSKIQWRTTSNEITRMSGDSSAASPTNYIFDQVIGPEQNNLDVYNAVAKDIVHGSIKGINGTIFAYGQTSSGKTFTMLGGDDQPGLIRYGIEEIFQLVEQATERMFLISMSYMEIYNEDVKDLLTGDSNMKIRESEEGSIYVENCGQQLVEEPSDVFRMMAEGDRLRHVGATNMNEMSSRSHAIATLYIESKLVEDGDDGAVLVAQLNFVDLAGSEKAGQTGAVGQRLKEGSHINASLLSLSTCINKLAEKSGHIPYRDSKLTRLLQNSLGGNSRTAVVANVTPASIEETISTLRFAGRAKKVSSKPIVNEVVDDRTLTRRLEKRVKELEQQLERKQHLDNAARQELLKDLLKPPEKTDEMSATRSRRQTWCPGPGRKAGVPLLDVSAHSFDFNSSAVEPSTAGASAFSSGVSAFKRPAPPGKVTHRRKKQAFITETLPEEEVFSDPREKLDQMSTNSSPAAVSPEVKSEILKLKDTIQQLQTENTKLKKVEAELESTRLDLQTSTSRISELEASKQQLESKLKESNDSERDRLKELNMENESLMSQIISLKEELTSHDSILEELTQLKAGQSVKDTEIDDLNINIVTMEDRFRTQQAIMEEEKASISQELGELKIRLEELESLPTELEVLKMEKNEIAQLKDAELSELRTKLQEMDSVAVAQSEQNSAAAISTEEDELVHLKEAEINEMRSQLESAKENAAKQVEGLQAELVQVKDQLDVMRERSEKEGDAEAAIAELKEAEGTLSLQNEQLKEENAALSVELETMKLDLEELQNPETSHDSTAEELAQLKACQTVKDMEIDELKLNIVTMEDRFRSQQAKLEEDKALTSQELGELKIRLEELESLPTELEVLKMEKNEIAQLKDAEVSELRTTLEELERVAVAQSEQNSAGAVSTEEDDLVRLKEAEIDEMRSQLESAKENAAKQVEDLQAELVQVRDQLDVMSKRSEKEGDAEAAIAELKEAEGTLSMQYEQLKEENSALSVELETMKLDLEELQTVSAELDIMRMEKNELVSLKDAELAEMKLKLEQNATEGIGSTTGNPELQVEPEQLRARIEELESVSAELDILKLEKNEILECKNSEISELRAKLSDANTASEDTIKLTADDLEQPQREETELEREESNKQLENEEKNLRLEQLNQEVEELNNKMEHLNQEVDQLCQDKLELLESERGAREELRALQEACSEDGEIREELEDARKGLELKDTQIHGLERGYNELNKQYNELIEYSNLEKEVYSCRTPGQVKEKELKGQLVEAEKTLEITEAQYKMEITHLRDSSTNLAEENYRLKQRLGEAPPSAKKRMLSPLQENSPDVKPADISLNSEAMPDLMTTLMESPDLSRLPPTKLNMSLAEDSPANMSYKLEPSAVSKRMSVRTSDAQTNTDMDFKWFELDDTILGIVKTGAASNKTYSPEDMSLVLQTPAKNLVCEVKSEVAEFKSGLEMAYGMIKDLQLQREQDEIMIATTNQDLQNKQRELDQLQQVLAEVNSLEEKYEHQLSELRARHKEEIIQLRDDLKQQHDQPAIEEISEEYERKMSDLRQTHRREIETLKTEHTTVLQSLDSKYQAELSQVKSDLETHRELHQSDLETIRETQKCDLESTKENLQKSHDAELQQLSESHKKSISDLEETYQEQLTAKEQYETKIQDLELQIEARLVDHECEIEALKLQILNQKDDEREPSVIDKTPGELETQIAELIQTHNNEIESLKTEHSTVLQTIDSKHLAELSQVKSELETQRESHKSDLESIRETQKCELEAVKEKHAADQENLQKTHKAEFEQLIESHKKTTAELDETSKQQLYISQQYERKIQDLELQMEACIVDHECQVEALKLQIHNQKDDQHINSSINDKSSADLERRISELTQTHSSDIEALKVEHASVLQALDTKHQAQLSQIKSELETQRDSHRSDLESIRETQKLELQSIKENLKKTNETEVEQLILSHKKSITDLEETYKQQLTTSQQHQSKIEEELSHKAAELSQKEAELSQKEAELSQKEAEHQEFMEKALEDRRHLADKYRISKERIAELEKQTSHSANQGSSVRSVLADKVKREKKLLEVQVGKLQKRLDNPEGEVKRAHDMQEHYKRECERYHDEITQIDYHIQQFGEEYFGMGDWYFEDLSAALRQHLPEMLKEEAAKAMAENPRRWIGGSPPPPPKKVEDKGELCEHLRRRQHFKIVALESDKAGLECENMKLKKDNKQIDKLHSEIFELKKQLHSLKQEHSKLEDLLSRTEQELYTARENAVPSIPDVKRAHGSSKLPPTDINVQMKIKGLEYEKYALNQKNTELETTLNKLRDKYIVLRAKYEKLAPDSSTLHASSIDISSHTSAVKQKHRATVEISELNESQRNSPKRVAVASKQEPITKARTLLPTAAADDINLDETENCNQQ